MAEYVVFVGPDNADVVTADTAIEAVETFANERGYTPSNTILVSRVSDMALMETKLTVSASYV